MAWTDTAAEAEGVGSQLLLDVALLVQPSLRVEVLWVREDGRIPANRPGKLSHVRIARCDREL